MSNVSLQQALDDLRGKRSRAVARVGLMKLLKGRTKYITVGEFTEAMIALQESYPSASDDDLASAMRDVEEGVRIYNLTPTEWLAHAIQQPTFMQEPFDQAEQWQGFNHRLRWVTAYQVIKLPGVRDHFVGQPQIGYWLHRLGLMTLGSPVARLADGTRAQRWAITDYFTEGRWKR